MRLLKSLSQVPDNDLGNQESFGLTSLISNKEEG